MSETMIHWIRALQILSTAVFATLYGLGGMEMLWRRRLVAPFIYVGALFGTACWLGSGHWVYFFMYPLFVGALVLGYGENSKIQRFTKNKYLTRAITGSAGGFAALPVAAVNGAWGLLCFHIVLCIATSVFLGARNPIKDARGEELTLGFVYGLLPMMMV